MDFENVTPDDIIYKGKQFFKGQSSKPAGIIVIILIALITIPTLFYTVQPSEIAVVRRFGKFVRMTKPGLHFKLPFNIERVDEVKVKTVFKEEFGFRTATAGVKTTYAQKSYDQESLVLTGDLNVLDVEWIVQYKKKDPVKYLFNIRNQEITIRDISESVMRAIIGDYTFNEVLTEQRVEVNMLAQKRMQNILDSYESGIQIVTVKLQDVNPPRPVQSAFNEVNEAKQEKEQMVNEAWKYYNQKIPEGKGKAKKIISEAKGYSRQAVNRAEGDAARFDLLYSAYKEAKDVTRKRIYLDKLKTILKSAGKIYIVDPSQKGILPLLNLDKYEK